MGTSVTAHFCLKIQQLISTLEYFQDTYCKLYAFFSSLHVNAFFLIFIYRYVYFNSMIRKNVFVVSNITLPGSVKKVKRTKDNFLKLVSH